MRSKGQDINKDFIAHQTGLFLRWLLCTIIYFSGIACYGQDSLNFRKLSLSEAYKLALENSYQLKASEKNAQNAKQQIAILQLNKLPILSADLAYGYISNADNWAPSLSDHRVSLIPHVLTTFSVMASEVVFKGGEIKHTIRKSAFQEQVAVLFHEKNIQDIKLLVSAKYLDIYRLISQQKIYMNNIRLTQDRLENVLKMQKQGMVTQNDVLRTQLIISDFKIALRRISNDIVILNKQLNTVMGLPDSIILIPDSSLLGEQHLQKNVAYYLELANNGSPDLNIAVQNNRIAETNIALLESERLPEVFLFAKSNLQRPFTNTLPAIDVYSNVWQAGIGIHYNISSNYQTKRKIKSASIKLTQANDLERLERQNLEVRVKAGFIKYNEAGEDLVALREDLLSAEENYRVVEKKYFNQLALLTDMIDATNTKIEAELKVTTARINVVYAYCQLLHITGIL